MQIKKLVLVLVTIFTMVIIPQPAFALDDGAYLIGRSTSYVNPLTGKTEDGGTNIALGDSMVSSIVESNLLLEQTGGKYYITIGLGLASNVSNVRFKIMNSSGTFSDVAATKTGSSSANGDTVNHYRIQISSLNVYISPIMYVDPMGRDVQFFIELNPASATPGTGVYTSQMIPANTNTQNGSAVNTDSGTSSNKNTDSNNSQNNTATDTPVEEIPETAPVTTVGTVTKETLLENVSGLSNYIIDENGKVDNKKELTVENLKNANSSESNESNSSLALIIGGIIIVLIIIAGGGFYYVKKIKK